MLNYAQIVATILEKLDKSTKELSIIFDSSDYDGELYHSWRLQNREHYYIIFKRQLEDFCKGKKEWTTIDLEWKAELRDLITTNKKEMEESRYMTNIYRGNPTGKSPFPNYFDVLRKRNLRELNYKESTFQHMQEGC